LTNDKQTSSKILHNTPGRKLFDFRRNPRKFVVDRWRAAVETYKLPDADQSLVEKVTNAQDFQNFMRGAIQEARFTKQLSRINPLITISGIQVPLWSFEKLIANVDDESESAEYVDVTDDVEVSHLWAMSYLNVKVRMLLVILLVRFRLTRLAIAQFCRQA
jgi:hypothetical protein